MPKIGVWVFKFYEMDPSQQKDLISKTLNGFLNQCNLATLTIHSTQGIERLKVECFTIGHKLN